MSEALTQNLHNERSVKPRTWTSKRKKTNILEKLHLLQIHGSFKDPRRGQTHRIFEELPRRLAFSLSNLIEGDDWKSEFTFLGFTRDSQFLLSYSCHYSFLGGNQMIDQYIRIYYMQWWLFVPYRPLEKIRETRLFGYQEIMDDLTLTICQWPTDDTKLLVYGTPNNMYSTRLDPDLVKCYYITVVAIPPLQPCSDCSALRVPDTELNERVENDTDSETGYPYLNYEKCCLLHSLVIHTRNMLVSPYPPFDPTVSLKINGLVIINSGDNLRILSIGIRECGETDAEKLKISNSLLNGQQRNTLPYSSATAVGSLGINEMDVNNACSCCSTKEQNLPKDWFHCDYSSLESFEEPSSNESDSVGAEVCEECGKEIILKWRSRLAFIKKEEDDTGGEMASFPKRNKLTEECFKELVITQDCSFKEENIKPEVDEKNIPEIKCLTIQLDNAWKDIECSDLSLKEEEVVKKSPTVLIPTPQVVTHNFSKHFEKENISPKLGRIMGVVPRLLSPKDKKLESNKVNEETVDNSEGALDIDVPSFGSPLSRPSSFADSLNQDQESGNSHQSHRSSGQCVSGNSQYFADWLEQSPSSPSQFEDVEDSAGTEYHNVLSFEVHGSDYKSLKQVNFEDIQKVGGSAIAVGQLNFDIELFAHEMAAEICKTARKKYLAFLDYDVQIIDVCEISLNVIALVIMQVQAMAGQKGVAKELRSSVRKVFLTGFKFEWNVGTGDYNVIDTDELVELGPNVGFIKENGLLWNPAKLKVTSLRKEFRVPQSRTKSVRVMSSANVRYGESLKILWAPGQDVAIVH